MSIVQDYVHQYIDNHVKIGPAFKDTNGQSGLFPTSYSELTDILKEGSYLFYEFKDIEKEYEVDVEHPEYGTYVKYISPLYADSIINDKDNQALLDIISEELPFYHMGYEGDAADTDYLVKSTRDAGINNVPSFMQTEFWWHWFRDVQGYIQNYVLLDVFNKLRYPFVNENQYLNAALFPELAQKAYNPSNDGGVGVTWSFLINLPYAQEGDIWKLSDVTDAPQSALDKGVQVGTFLRCEEAFVSKIDPDAWDTYWEVYKEGSSLIEFKTSEADNQADKNDPNSVGCLDYLNDVVEQKLESIYSLIDYNPDQSRLLSDWSESLYESGKINYSDLEKEKTIFKLQDIQYELLKRKFAGASTLYNLALSSIDRQGSFASIIRVGDLVTSYTAFKDIRFLRILNIPGILSQFADLTDLDPIKAYYTQPVEDGEMPMELGTVTPLFYTSATMAGSDGLLREYNAETFYNLTAGDNLSYRNTFLRDNNSVIEWNNPPGIISSKSINSVWEKLDNKIPDPITGELTYLKMDTEYTPDPEKPEETYPIRLDISSPVYNTTSVIGNVLDVSANRLLYHRNVIQKEQGILYPYLTYNIADGNSVSLMDTSWITYLKSSTERKSRVQDDVVFGVQFSRYSTIPAEQTTESIFFGITYGNSEEDYVLMYDLFEAKGIYEAVANPEDSQLSYYYEWINSHYVKTEDTQVNPEKTYFVRSGEKDHPKFAYLWYCNISYDVETFEVKNVGTSLISKISLVVEPDARYESIDTFLEMERNNLGILPFTYTDVDPMSLRLGVYTDEVSEGVFETKFFDDIADLGYSKAYYVFSKYDTLKNYSELKGEPSTSASNSRILELIPSEETKALFYILPKVNKTDSSITEYYWSESIKIIPLNSLFLEGLSKSSYKPDWYKMDYHLNPYLNFTANSASALRHHQVIPAYLYQEVAESELIGPSEYCGLSNLCRSRHMDFVCNDSGEKAPTNWVADWEEKYENLKAQGVYGLYLKRFKPSDPKSFDLGIPEWITIRGDNRDLDVYDESTERPEGYTPEREVIYSGKMQIPSLNFAKGEASETSTVISENYLQILPCKSPTAEAWNNWYWNKITDGISLCLNIDGSYESWHATVREQGYIRLVHRDDEFSLDIVGDEYQSVTRLKIRFTFYPQGSMSGTAWTVDSDFLPYAMDNTGETSFWPSDYFNFRIAAGTDLIESSSGNEVRLLLVVNNDIKVEVYNTSSITFASDLNQMGDSPSTFIPGSPIKGKTTASNKPIELFTRVAEGDYVLSGGIWAPDVTYYQNIGGNYTKVVPHPGSTEDVSSFYVKPIKQYNSFTGNVYDLRLYNTGFTPENLYLLAGGSTRELYSYSPSIYKLGYSIYEDYGILKTVGRRKDWDETNGLPDVEVIRIFNRSVWDSILLDMYPISAEESDPEEPQFIVCWRDPLDDTDVYDKEGDLDDCISQVLQDSVEVYNGASPLSSNNARCRIKYYNNTYDINNEDVITLVTSSLYPVNYNNHPFNSYTVLKWDEARQVAYTDENNPITIPISPAKGTLRYTADLELNFTVNAESDLSNWYSRGDNISLIYNEALGKPVATLTNTTIKDSNRNHILIPLKLPKQTELKITDQGYLDRLHLRGVQLNAGLTTFLRATSYYNELRFPVAKQASLKGTPTYTSKWDAIRVLREGTYYFTCKYPVQILPYLDYLYNTSSNSGYATVYASARFKVEVKGRPIEYDNSKYAISGYPKKYLYDNLENTLSSNSGLVIDDDNRTFPHRQIDIDLYVMDVQGVAGQMLSTGEENYYFTWRLLGSNHQKDFKTLTTPVITLDKKTLESSLVIADELPLFFSKNYTSPFFIAKTTKLLQKTIYDATSADDDLISPYDVKGVYNTSNVASERITVDDQDDLDKQCLIAGRSYKLLFDYDGQVSEISFTDNVYTPDADTWVDDTYLMENSEKVNFSRLVNLLDTTTSSVSEYAYDGNSNWFVTKDINVKSKTSGFKIDKENEWTSIGLHSSEYHFGNPYSRSSDANYLLKTNSSDRYNVDNSITFPYVPEDVPKNTFVSSAYVTSVDAITTKLTGGVYTIKTLPVSEIKAIEDQWTRILGTVTGALSSLRSNASGLFTSVSTVVPGIIYSAQSALVKTVDYIYANTHDFYGYHASGRSVPSKNSNILISRRGLYSNNLIRNQNFLDKTSWYSNQVGYYEADADWDHGLGKDVLRYDFTANEEVILKYITGSKIVGAKYETAINVRSAAVEEVEAAIAGPQALVDQYYATTSEGIRQEILERLQSKYGYSSIAEAEAAIAEMKESEFDSITVQAQYIISNGSSEVVTSTVDLLPTTRSQSDENHVWYIFEAETPSVVSADRVAFKITSTRNQAIRITKAVVRKSDNTSHYLGLADALYATASSSDSSRVALAPHSSIFYKDKVTGEVVPIQFHNEVKKRTINTSQSVSYVDSGQNLVAGFINAYSLGEPNKDSKLELLFEPWVQKLNYWQEKGEVSNKLTFYGYSVGTDSAGLKSKVVVPSEVENIYDISKSKLVYNYNKSCIEITSLKFKNTSNLNLLSFNSTLELNTEDPISVTSEKLSGISNCFNPSRHQQGLSTPIAITNVQLLSKIEEDHPEREIIYELEYLPIIYDEKDQHISMNIFLHRKIAE